MIESKFYVLKIGVFGQFKFAWYETTNEARYSDDCPRCPVCNRAVGMLYWLPPYEVIIKQPRRIGDFVAGSGDCDFLISERCLNLFHQQGLTGIQAVLPITVTRMGTTAAARQLKPPPLYGVYLEHTLTRLKYDEMGIIWGEEPQTPYCQVCGPGGGGGPGWWMSRERVVVDPLSWTGEDIFFAMNGPGTILLSQKAADVILENGLTNATVIPCELASYSHLTGR